MGFYNVINRALLQQNQPEDISQVLANLDAIASVVNGGLDNNNIAPTAAITASRLAGYPADAVKVLKGDGSWAPPGGVDYKNVWDVAFPYTQGDVVTYQGVTYVAVNPSTGVPPPAGGPQAWTLGRGLSLPASPVDGQEYILTDSLTASTYNWRFRYNAGSVSAYKWEYIGGTPMVQLITATESSTVTGGYVDLGTVGPQLTIPRAGDYFISFWASMNDSTAQTFIQTALGIGAFAVAMITGISSVAAGNWTQVAAATPTYGAVAGTTFRLRYWQFTAGTMQVRERTLSIIPLRVS